MLHSNVSRKRLRRARIILEDENVLSWSRNLFLSDLCHPEKVLPRLDLFSREFPLHGAPNRHQTYWNRADWKDDDPGTRKANRKYFSTQATSRPSKILGKLATRMNWIRKSSIEHFNISNNTAQRLPLTKLMSSHDQSLPHLERQNTSRVFHEIMKVILGKLMQLSVDQDEEWEIELGPRNWVQQRIAIELNPVNTNGSAERNLLQKNQHGNVPLPARRRNESNEVVYFWVLDTDGLEVSIPLLNQSRSTSVNPLKPFFELGLKTRWRKNETHEQAKDNFLHLLQQRNAGRSYADHFVLFLHPNMEVFDYDTTALERDRFEQWRQIDGGYGCSYLSSQERGAYVVISDDGRQLVEEQLEKRAHANKSMLHYQLSKEDSQTAFEVSTEDVGFQHTLVSSAIYLKKRRLQNENNFLPFRKRSSLIKASEIRAALWLAKWTYFRTHNTDRIDRRHVSWSEANRCGAPTLLSAASFSENQRSMYAEGINGKKPCARKLNHHLRCHQHR